MLTGRINLKSPRSLRVDITDPYTDQHVIAFVPNRERAAKVVLRYFEQQVDEHIYLIESIQDDLNSNNPDEQDLEYLVNEMDSLMDHISDWNYAQFQMHLTHRSKFEVAGVYVTIKGW